MTAPARRVHDQHYFSRARGTDGVSRHPHKPSRNTPRSSVFSSDRAQSLTPAPSTGSTSSIKRRHVVPANNGCEPGTYRAPKQLAHCKRGTWNLLFLPTGIGGGVSPVSTARPAPSMADVDVTMKNCSCSIFCGAHAYFAAPAPPKRHHYRRQPCPRYRGNHNAVVLDALVDDACTSTGMGFAAVLLDSAGRLTAARCRRAFAIGAFRRRRRRPSGGSRHEGSSSVRPERARASTLRLKRTPKAAAVEPRSCELLAVSGRSPACRAYRQGELRNLMSSSTASRSRGMSFTARSPAASIPVPSKKSLTTSRSVVHALSPRPRYWSAICN